MTSRRLRFPGDLPVFAVHLPGFPILPGGLLIDVGREMMPTASKAGAWSAAFHRPIAPDVEIEMVQVAAQGGRQFIDMMDDGQLCARLGVSPRSAAPPETGAPELGHSSWRKPTLARASCLSFLDGWCLAAESEGEVSTQGFCAWSPRRLDLIAPMILRPTFGEGFALIEMIGECALTGLHVTGRIEAPERFGLIRVADFRRFGADLRDGADVVCQVSSRAITRSVVTWSGCAFQDGCLVAAVAGVSAPLRRGSP